MPSCIAREELAVVSCAQGPVPGRSRHRSWHARIRLLVMCVGQEAGSLSRAMSGEVQFGVGPLSAKGYRGGPGGCIAIVVRVVIGVSIVESMSAAVLGGDGPGHCGWVF
jgi:hypothetical protein